MNADMLKRVIRTISDGSVPDLQRLAKKIIDLERRSGHLKLADQLETILNQPRPRRVPDRPTGDTDRGMRELPLSRRHRESLATILPTESLEHMMVLPPETEERFERIEQEFAARTRLGVFGLQPRKTILLYGPPGCGKSLGAKRLAWKTGLPLMKVRFDTLISSYFGESAANLRSIFVAAKEHPCVLLLDECDFIARSRLNSKDIGEASRIVNSLLQLMEDYDAPGLLVATTNVETSLDPALFRRFDDVFLVPLPGPEEIRKLLQLTLSSVRPAELINWDRMVEALAGSSAAVVVKAAQDAAKAAVLRGHKRITEADLTQAITELRRHKDFHTGG
jgi:SpoVK/Ycf46/Vps4 family AAA+-type ATPase